MFALVQATTRTFFSTLLMEQQLMDAFKTIDLASAIALLAAGLAATPAHASSDVKSLSPVRCQPMGPSTDPSELRYTHTGIFNPRTTGEWVVCELPMDSETAYATTRSNRGYVN